jgi:2-polyprenyl-3-methyl-5-hydroxy-6-metoxy-1,4-benzoquinol methylase
MQTTNHSTNSTSFHLITTRARRSMAETLRVSACPACGDQVAVPFMDEEHQPLATLAWPKSREEAESMKRLPLAFVRCASCGHVYNTKFRYEEVPYSLQPNLMFNRGIGWSKHLLFVRDLILGYLPAEPTVVEIGCGSGHLLQSLAQANPHGRYIGFDPSVSSAKAGSLEFRGELFLPDRHLHELRPHMLISRHVLEHMLNPLGFLQAIAMAAELTQTQTLLFTEVPCIDRVFEAGRVEDFYYEHNSHFTTQSFTRMLHRANASLQMLVHHYNGEVISGIVRFGSESSTASIAATANQFRARAKQAKQTVGKQLSEIHRSGRRVVIWGGTGKAAAFMNYFGVDADRFPLVVDSDPDKSGTYVPGMGQKISARESLLMNPADIVIIPMQWRAKDVVAEMDAAGIRCSQVLIEHQGKLIDYHVDPHPYAR